MQLYIVLGKIGGDFMFEIETIEELIYYINEKYQQNSNNPQFICEIKIIEEIYTIRKSFNKYEYKNSNKTAKFIELNYNPFPMTKEILLNISKNLKKALN